MESILDSYPKLDFRGNDKYFNDELDFENYCENILPNHEIDDNVDVYTVMANEADFDDISDWLEKEKEDYREADFLLEVVRSAKKFFIVYKIILE